jgi:hypothetical protein
MSAESKVGEITKGGQPVWSYDLRGMSMFWIPKAEELDRMVRLGFVAWTEDCERIRETVRTDGAVPYDHPPSTLTVCFFLAALAVENLLKGCLVVEKPETIKDGRFRGDAIGSHDLLVIAREAGVSLTNDEEDFCRIGTEAIMSFGRYHMSKKAQHDTAQLTIKQSAFPIYEALFNKLHRRLKETPWKRADGSGPDYVAPYEPRT